MKAKHVGLDIAKSVFQAHGTDANGKSVFKCKLGRSKVSAFFAKLGPFEVVLEACGSAHYWARVISRVGHDVRLGINDGQQPDPFRSGFRGTMPARAGAAPIPDASCALHRFDR
ncbi:ISCro5 transposase [Acetobacter senegalensis]|uniref:ISCro5 transposase n=1 Tax=Acetobacter senegalensis TaxID=446692 RepID=A0A0U5EUX7_9PROT|nr:ISCro5 transposase [Acetobacter senegalensis]